MTRRTARGSPDPWALAIVDKGRSTDQPLQVALTSCKTCSTSRGTFLDLQGSSSRRHYLGEPRGLGPPQALIDKVRSNDQPLQLGASTSCTASTTSGGLSSTTPQESPPQHHHLGERRELRSRPRAIIDKGRSTDQPLQGALTDLISQPWGFCPPPLLRGHHVGVATSADSEVGMCLHGSSLTRFGQPINFSKER